MSEARRITGGRAVLTGVIEGGPQGTRIKGDRLREIKRGDNAPHDSFLEFDCTPHDAEGDDFGPMPESELGKRPEERQNPEFEGVETFDGDPNTQAVRLQFDYEGDGSADLANEYANHGCTPRIRVRTPPDGGGRLTNLRFVAAGGVVIPVRPSSINIGRH